MIPKDVISLACKGKFKPYTVEFKRRQRSGFILFGTYTIDIYNLCYDGTPLMEGGKQTVERWAELANSAYNQGILNAHILEE